MKFSNEDKIIMKNILTEYLKINNLSQRKLEEESAITRQIFAKILKENYTSLHLGTLKKFLDFKNINNKSKKEIEKLILKYCNIELLETKKELYEDIQFENIKKLLSTIISSLNLLSKNDEKILQIKDVLIDSLLTESRILEKQKSKKKINEANEYMQVRSFSSDFSSTARAINLLFKLKSAPVGLYSELMLILSSNSFKSNQKMAKGIKETAEEFIRMGEHLLEVIEPSVKMAEIIEEE